MAFRNDCTPKGLSSFLSVPRYAKIPEDLPAANSGGSIVAANADSDLDSDDDREKKLIVLQEQLRHLQEQVNMLVEDTQRSKAKRSRQSATVKNKAAAG